MQTMTQTDPSMHDQRTATGAPLALLLALTATLVTGCSDTAANDPGQVPTNTTQDACGFAVAAAATIDISERSDVWHDGFYARVEAQTGAGSEPNVHAVVVEAANCRLLELMYGECTSACAADEVCQSTGECAAEPEGLAAGTLRVSGLADAVAIESQSWSPGRYDSPSLLSADLFREGDTVQASLAGADFPGLILGARGVASMDPALTASGYVLTDGEDARLTWTPGPDPDACVSVTLKGRNAVHGAPLGSVIECFGPDTGSLTIPQAIVEAFPTGETPEVTNGYDWPHSELTRYTRTSLDTEHGPAVLTVRSTTYFQMSHPD